MCSKGFLKIQLVHRYFQKILLKHSRTPTESSTPFSDTRLKFTAIFSENVMVFLGRNTPNTLFFIWTSKFCLRLAVLNFFFSFLRLKCSYFPTEPCNATKKNVRVSTIKTRHFISLILFPLCSAHRLRGVLQKIGSGTVIKPIKKYLRRSSIFHQSCRLQVCNFTKVKLLHRYFS